MIWAEREVKVEDGNFLMSRKGDPTNWDFAPVNPDGKEALAGNVGAAVIGLKPIDDRHLLIEAENGNFVLIDDDTRTMRIVRQEDFVLGADKPAVVMGKVMTAGERATKLLADLNGQLEHEDCHYLVSAVIDAAEKDAALAERERILKLLKAESDAMFLVGEKHSNSMVRSAAMQECAAWNKSIDLIQRLPSPLDSSQSSSTVAG
jgi:hypothetical protein